MKFDKNGFLNTSSHANKRWHTIFLIYDISRENLIVRPLKKEETNKACDVARNEICVQYKKEMEKAKIQPSNLNFATGTLQYCLETLVSQEQFQAARNNIKTQRKDLQGEVVPVQENDCRQ